MSEDVLERAANHVKQCSCKTDWRRPDGYKGKCLDCEHIEALASEVRALRKDRERLDWLLDSGVFTRRGRKETGFGWEDQVVDLASLDVVGRGSSDREAIDAAMAREVEK